MDLLDRNLELNHSTKGGTRLAIGVEDLYFKQIGYCALPHFDENWAQGTCSGKRAKSLHV